MPDNLDEARAELRAALILAVMDQYNVSMAEATDTIRDLRWRDFDLDKGIVRLPRRLPDLPADVTAALRRRTTEMSDSGGMLFGDGTTIERDHESNM